MLLVATSLCLWKLPQKYINRNANSHYFKHQRGRKTSSLALTCHTRKKKQEQHYKKRPISVYYHWLVLLWHILSPLVTDSTSPQDTKGVFDVISSRKSSKPRFSTQRFSFFQHLYCLFWSPCLFSCASYARPLFLHITCLCSLPGRRTRSLDAIPDSFCVNAQFFALSCSSKNFPVCIKTKTTGSQLSLLICFKEQPTSEIAAMGTLSKDLGEHKCPAHDMGQHLQWIITQTPQRFLFLRLPTALHAIIQRLQCTLPQASER